MLCIVTVLLFRDPTLRKRVIFDLFTKVCPTEIPMIGIIVVYFYKSLLITFSGYSPKPFDLKVPSVPKERSVSLFNRLSVLCTSFIDFFVSVVMQDCHFSFLRPELMLPALVKAIVTASYQVIKHTQQNQDSR